MGKLDKLIELFLRQPPEVRFADVLYLLEAFGYIEQRSKGSHHTFSDPDGETLEETIKNINEARELWLETVFELGKSIPLPSD